MEESTGSTGFAQPLPAVEAENIPESTTTPLMSTVGDEELHSKSLNALDGLSDEDLKLAATPKVKPAVRNKKRHSVGGTIADAEVKLKRRKINVAGAPKMPLTGYVRFMNDRREELRREYPNKTSLEHTKIIGEEWSSLPAERKEPYLSAAAEDKQRYMDELNNFLKAHPEILASEIAKNKAGAKKGGNQLKTNTTKEKPQIYVSNCDVAHNNGVNNKINDVPTQQCPKSIPAPLPPPQPIPIPTDPDELPLATSLCIEKTKRTPTPIMSNPTVTSSNNGHNNSTSTNGCTNSNGVTVTNSQTTYTSGEIPIFTNEFLDHNRNLDLDFRTLRKQRTELEQQNAVLDKHVENTSIGLTKVNNEIDDLTEQNRQLRAYLNQTKLKLIGALNAFPIPTEPTGANIENIDKYITDLYNMAKSNTHGPGLNKARDIIRKLDLPSRPNFNKF